MNDQDCIIMYNHLIDILRQNELNWIIEQVNEQIRLGKTEVTEIRPSFDISYQHSLPGVDISRRVTSRKAERFLLSAEYTPRDRLLLLVDAIEQAVVNTNLMAHEATNFFKENYIIGSISFYSQENQTIKTFEREEFVRRASQAQKLKLLLDTLRKQLHAN